MCDNKDDFSHIRQPPDQTRNLCHAIKIQPAGRFVKHQQVFPTNHADRYRHPLLLTSGQGIGVAVSEWGQGQLFQCCVNERLFRIADTECTF